MTLPFSLGTIPLPDWLPPWVPVALLIPAVLWVMLLIAMPFAVLGTRARLEGIEAQLDDLHAEVRNLAMQIGAPLAPTLVERSRESSRAGRPEPDSAASSTWDGGRRSEPRIGWSRGADD